MHDAKTVFNTVKNQLAKTLVVDRNKAVPSCRGCMYYHPEFRYRKCLKSVCPYGKCEKEVFRSRPLQGPGRILLPKPVV